ncbi:MAG: hypothetical protein F4Y26_19940 [Gammaproteobacteria bacterium]|nr:hypothetical protein [Gammaproteobacteria bacterium]
MSDPLAINEDWLRADGPPGLYASHVAVGSHRPLGIFEGPSAEAKPLLASRQSNWLSAERGGAYHHDLVYVEFPGGAWSTGTVPIGFLKRGLHEFEASDFNGMIGVAFSYVNSPVRTSQMRSMSMVSGTEWASIEGFAAEWVRDIADAGGSVLVHGSSAASLVVAEFAQGVSEIPRPTSEAVARARRLVGLAGSHIANPDFSVDVDGELSFDHRRADGYQVFAELSLKGRLDVGIYDENDDMVRHDTNATDALFKAAVSGEPF